MSKHVHDPEVEHYFKAMTYQFERGQDHDWAVGGGLYAAVDSLPSGNFAGNPWIMLQISVPKGTRYLDARSEQMAALISHLSRDTKAYSEVRRFLKSERLVMIAYNWTVSGFMDCQHDSSTSGSRTAFNFIEPSSYDLLDIKLFSSVLESNPSPDKADAYLKLLKEVAVGGFELTVAGEVIESTRSSKSEFSSNVITPAWAGTLTFIPESMSKTEQKEQVLKIHEEVFSCSPDHPEEWATQ